VKKKLPKPRAAAKRSKARPLAKVRNEAASPNMDPTQLLATRELFWLNVIREILTSLSAICAMRPQPAVPELAAKEAAEEPAGTVDGPPADAGADAAPESNLFDGRLAIMTRSGERVAISHVFPLYACSISHPGEQSIAHAVECTVFQIRTPGGEVYTLPLHEIRAFHSLTPELMAQLERAERRRRPGDDLEESRYPFGFAAYTSLVQGLPNEIEAAPQEPIE